MSQTNMPEEEEMTAADEQPTMSQLQELVEGKLHDQQVQIEEQRESIALLQTKLAALDHGSNDADSAAPVPKRLSRKGLLGAAAAGAAGLIGAGTFLHPEVAAATNNDPVLVGGYYTATSFTQIDASGAPGNVAFIANSGGTGDGVQGTNYDSGLYSGHGLYGSAQSGTGVYGVSTSRGTGVFGNSAGYIGVFGTSTSGIGVHGDGGTYGGEFSGGLANLLLDPGVSQGAPGAQAHVQGEIFVDSIAVPYICEANGTPGSWQAVGNFRPFPAGHRVFNASMIPGALVTGISALTDVHALPTGVPATAIAAYCAVQSYKTGTLTIFPDGASEPTAANWSGGGITGALNLLYMLVPLSAAGKFSVRSHLAAAGQVYVDVWGYLM